MEGNDVARGYYFLIRSKLNRLVLTLKSPEITAGVPVVMWPKELDPQKQSRSQLWYYDRVTSTIRTKDTDLCMDTANGTVCLASFNQTSKTQVMKISEKRILCFHGNQQSEQVLEVEKSNLMPGTKIVPFADMELDNQQWSFIYQPAIFFKLRSGVNNKILDVFKEEKKPGAKVTVWTDKLDHSTNQLWYEDSNGFVRSKLNNFILDSSDGQFKLMPPESGQEHQQWVISNGRIVNTSPIITQVAMIKEKGAFEGARLITSEFSQDNLAQIWKKEFIS